MRKSKDENVKTFYDWTHRSWFIEESKIKVGNNVLDIMNGECDILEVKEILHGDQRKTWVLVIDTADKIYLLKNSRKLK